MAFFLSAMSPLVFPDFFLFPILCGIPSTLQDDIILQSIPLLYPQVEDSVSGLCILIAHASGR